MNTHPYARFFDKKLVESLRQSGMRNLEGAVALVPEKDSTGQFIPAMAFWLWFGSQPEFPGSLPSEGKLYVPNRHTPAPTLIHYSPSAPVGNAGRFEHRYIRGLIKAGYHVFTGRRNGAALHTPRAQEVINSSLRIELARQSNQAYIGSDRKEGYTPLDAINEPITTLWGLAPAFAHIRLLSQSFGSSSHYHAMSQLHDNQRDLYKLGNIVNIAGYIGKHAYTEKDVWDGTALPAHKFLNFQVEQMRKTGFNYPTEHGVPEFRKSMQQVAKVNGEIRGTEKVGHVFFNCVNDPFVTGPLDQQPETLMKYGPPAPNKLFISMCAPKGDPRPHSMDFLSVDDLINALERKVVGISFESR